MTHIGQKQRSPYRTTAVPSHVETSPTYPYKKRNYVSRVSCHVPVFRPGCVLGWWRFWSRRGSSRIIIKSRKLMKNDFFFPFSCLLHWNFLSSTHISTVILDRKHKNIYILRGWRKSVKNVFLRHGLLDNIRFWKEIHLQNANLIKQMMRLANAKMLISSSTSHCNKEHFGLRA